MDPTEAGSIHFAHTHKLSRIALALVLLITLWISPLPHSALADSGICATPGKDGPGGVLSGIINTYYPGSASVPAGSSTIPVGASYGSSTSITAGDLLIVMQMQDAAIDSTNSDSYGDGVGGSPASGSTALNNAGRYEYVIATGPVSTGFVPILGAGPGDGLVYAYTDATATSTQGQRRFQVIRVPQYTSATLSSSLTALSWNGEVGGVLVLDVAGTLTLGGTVDLSGFGFRGGGGRQRSGSSGLSNTDYRTPASLNPNGSKGEGVAGTPRLVFDGSAVTDTGVEGYPNGSMARGAPGNAGGGGTDGRPSANDENSGGGGGGNGGAGGVGGNTWNSNLPRGGHGGATFPAVPDRLTIGGGGGAGTRNNTPGDPIASSGGVGGGMAIIRADTVAGSGVIAANGTQGVTPDNDGGGGGGAGGTVLFLTDNGGLGGLTVEARGGDGADSWPTRAPGGYPGERHGPGGGGGGGVVLLSDPAISIDVSGGDNGITTTADDPYGALPGADGVARTDVTPDELPSSISEFMCIADLQLSKSVDDPAPNIGDNVTFTIVLDNNGPDPATNVEVTDTLPAGVTYLSSSPSQGTFSSATGVWDVGSLVSGASASLDITASVDATGLLTNAAEVTAADQYDPDSTPGDGAGDDYDTADLQAQEADLDLQKMVDDSNPTLGDTINYTVIVVNFGPDDATNVIFTDTLPAGQSLVVATASQGTCTGTTTIICDLGGLANGASANVVISVTVRSIGPTTNTGNVIADQYDPLFTNNSAAVSLTVAAPSLPATGFAPGTVTNIPMGSHPVKELIATGLRLEIDKLNLSTSIVGVPLTEEGWDVTWLWNQVGYIEGTAFPTWPGNTALTGHVYRQDGFPGPFHRLSDLTWGDQIVIRAQGRAYTYEVRESRIVLPDDRSVIRHETYDWLTLITCQGYDDASDSYRLRRVIRAVLMDVE
jgi:LPXTG-site transpeptidase (sortase) family protein